MTSYQRERRAEIVVGKLREAEGILISLETEEPKNEAWHDAKILVWKAIDEAGKANV